MPEWLLGLVAGMGLGTLKMQSSSVLRRAVQLAAIEANRELERSGDPCDPMVLLQRCGEDDAAAELWDLET